MKKQQIILTHGNAIPSAEVIRGLKLGEVLVQHAAEAKDAALHTVIKEATESEEGVLVSFPSKEWVEAEIDKVDAGGINDTITALQDQVAEIEANYKAADTAEAKARAEADTAIRGEFAAADTALDTKFAGLLAGEVEELDEKIGAANDAIALKVAQSDYDEKIGKIDTAIAGFTDVLEGYTTKTSVKNAIDSKVAQSDYDEKIGEINEAIQAVDDKFDTLGDTYYTETEIDTKLADINNAITAAKVNISGVNANDVGVFVTETKNEEDGHFSYSIEAKGLATSEGLEALSDIVSTMQGNDADKSIRTIATEEAAAAVANVVANADEDFDTLKEVADWILNDTTGAAKLQTDVAKLVLVTNGYEGDSAIKTAVDGIDDRVAAIEEDYLKGADKTELDGKIAAETEARGNAIDAEAQARAEADNAINAKLGGNYSSESTVADAIQAVDDKIGSLGDTYYTETEIDTKLADINNAIAAAKVDISGVNDGTVGVFVTETENEEDSHISYSIEAKGLATSDRLDGVDDRLATVEGNYVNKITYLDAQGETVELPATNNVIDLSGLVIDGGTY